MPDWLTTHRSRPWHHAGHRILRPFSDPEKVPGEHPDWCRHCLEYATGRKEGRFEGSVYAFKVTCRRCGAVVRYALYNQTDDTSLGQRARQWATTPERIS